MDFEPFQDRLSRDIRNDLGGSIIDVLATRSAGPAQRVADAYLQGEPEQCYREYIRDRLARYRRVIAAAAGFPKDDVFRQACLLWDEGLFFEVHELLEHAWYDAAGRYKKILQAMIRAAGVYIKLEYGYTAGARKLAAHALPVLTAEKDFLARYFPPDRLLSALQDLDPHPPLLAD